MKCHSFRVFRHQIAIGFLFIDIIVSFCIVFVLLLHCLAIRQGIDTLSNAFSKSMSSNRAVILFRLTS